MLEGNLRRSVQQRLRRIAGQVQGLERMVEQKRYCIDILQQIAAVEAALHRVAGIILRNHMETCVSDAFQADRMSDRQDKIRELVQVFESFKSR